MLDDCLFCNAFMCDICTHRDEGAGNDDVSLGLSDDLLFDSILLGVELSSERECGDPAFDPW